MECSKIRNHHVGPKTYRMRHPVFVLQYGRKKIVQDQIAYVFGSKNSVLADLKSIKFIKSIFDPRVLFVAAKDSGYLVLHDFCYVM